ncbi:MAG: AbrB/MazE/SpoVT family DNA-binding domain-containing protein [Ferrovibrio sp.]|uniref:AbrB/MazE/SpoVT family DNA-binding domain-containing protein n=1 Tax=Ferrovibrio sp. TaxID=1917215 RepID=UPI0026259C90|nr:AbrB/MazE/SpoVT family DNA-binding domain-containing protein [Ferrovibrio sp.]MCW0232954.1 AbrB/MazE/SpoVT family DNA-binding domain-containing protein [Ferrovibrio sp.]
MRITVKQWGNSAAVRLPTAILEASGLKLDQQVEIREEHGRIVIEPVEIEPEEIDIEAICAQLDPNEKPELVDFGPPVGSEVW